MIAATLKGRDSLLLPPAIDFGYGLGSGSGHGSLAPVGRRTCRLWRSTAVKSQKSGSDADLLRRGAFDLIGTPYNLEERAGRGEGGMQVGKTGGGYPARCSRLLPGRQNNTDCARGVVQAGEGSCGVTAGYATTGEAALACTRRSWAFCRK